MMARCQLCVLLRIDYAHAWKTGGWRDYLQAEGLLGT